MGRHGCPAKIAPEHKVSGAFRRRLPFLRHHSHHRRPLAAQVAVQEMRRLQRHGITPGELERYKAALLRDSEQLAEQAGSVPSVDTLDFVMESLALGHTVMDQRQVCCRLSSSQVASPNPDRNTQAGLVPNMQPIDIPLLKSLVLWD